MGLVLSQAMMLSIRPVTPQDLATVWSILEPVLRAGETYALARDISEADAMRYWCGPTHRTFLAEEHGKGLGTYYLRANQGGGGAHVANCGYVTALLAQGRGVARRMLDHSLSMARQLGFRAMQFNFVVSTNQRAVDLWLANGFSIAGRLPLAFEHPREGLVDALIMHRLL
jgi:GNAT superfamily N-acetyltransferase